jgi:hypothetical protein
VLFVYGDIDKFELGNVFEKEDLELISEIIKLVKEAL